MGISRKSLPSREYLLECFEIIGRDLIWRERPAHHHRSQRMHTRFNRKFPGLVAGVMSSDGYRVVTIDGVPYKAHRIVWKMTHGTEPEILDHRDHDQQNNAPENLREATQSQNFFNSPRPKNNTSGFKGVTQDKVTGRYRAMIGDSGRPRHIGCYQTAEEAARAYMEEARRVAGQFARA